MTVRSEGLLRRQYLLLVCTKVGEYLGYLSNYKDPKKNVAL
jgi:hypothetical protein